MSRPSWITTHIAAISIIGLLVIISPAAYFYLQSERPKNDVDAEQSDPGAPDFFEPDSRPLTAKKKGKKAKKRKGVRLEEFYEANEEELVDEGSMQVKGVRNFDDMDIDVLGGLRGTK